MIKLHGFAVSNYFNMVNFVLLTKNIEHQLVATFPSQQDDFLLKSPRGMVPFIETEEGFISETSAIIEYLDQCYPTPALLPQAPFELAKVRELARMIELYIELPARRLYGELLFNKPADPETKKHVQASLTKGITAIASLATFSPYTCGEQLSIADVYLYFSLTLANKVSIELLDQDLLKQIPSAKTTLELLEQLPAINQINLATKEALASFSKR